MTIVHFIFLIFLLIALLAYCCIWVNGQTVELPYPPLIPEPGNEGIEFEYVAERIREQGGFTHPKFTWQRFAIALALSATLFLFLFFVLRDL